MTSKPDGGAAFPLALGWVETDQNTGNQKTVDVRDVSHGMTLRDYFAAAALQGMCANADVVERIRDTAHAENIDPRVLLATAAFGAADAMLQERTK